MDITSTILNIGKSYLFGLAGRRSSVNQVEIYVKSRNNDGIDLRDFLNWISSRSLLTYVEVKSNPASKKGIKDRLHIKRFLAGLKSNELLLDGDKFWEIYGIDHKEQLAQIFNMPSEKIVTMYEQDPCEMEKLEEEILRLENRRIIK